MANSGSKPATAATLKVLGDLDLFEKWRESGYGPMTTAELATLTGGRCDSELLRKCPR